MDRPKRKRLCGLWRQNRDTGPLATAKLGEKTGIQLEALRELVAMLDSGCEVEVSLWKGLGTKETSPQFEIHFREWLKDPNADAF